MSIMQFSGAFSVGKSTNRGGWYTSSDQKPGPGTYNPTFYDRPKFPKWKFVKTKRKSIIEPNNNPPPGTYDQKSTMGNGLKYSLIFRSEKEKEKKRYDIVGPGTYDPLLPGKFTLPAFSFSYKANPKDMDNRVPGPGTYPKEERFEEMTEQEIKIKNRLELKSEKEKFRKTGFGFSTRDSHSRYDNEKPGPGHYHPKNFDKLESPSYRFGMENRETLYSRGMMKTSPGPGQYETRRDIKTSHAYSLYGKIDPDFTKNEKKPGPEKYDPKPIQSFASIKFAKSERDTFSNPKIKKPGPGAYTPRLYNTTHTFSIGHGNRTDLVQKDGFPGPGSYNSDKNIMDGPKHSMASKLEKKNTQMKPVFPGPGAYEPKTDLVFPQTTIVSLKKDKKMKDVGKNVPGPGNYNINREFGGLKFSIGGLLKKPKPTIYLEPGPGHYDIPSTIGYIPKYLSLRNNPKNDVEITNYFEFKNF